MSAQVVEQRLLDSIWQELKQPPPYMRSLSKERFRGLLSDGWLNPYDFEVMLEGQDYRLSRLIHNFEIPVLVTALGYCPQTVLRKPTSKSNSVAGGDNSLSAFDITAFLIDLETLGFCTDPSPIVEALLPQLSGRSLFTHGELRVLKYKKVRNKEIMSFRSPKRDENEISGEKVHEHKTNSGTDLHCVTRTDGSVLFLTAIGSQYKSQRQSLRYA